MSSKIIVGAEIEGIAEAQVDVSLSSEMKYRIDVELAKTLENVGGLGDIAVEETKIWPPFQHPRVVPRTAIIQLVEGYNIVRFWVLRNEVAHQPGGTASDQIELVFGSERCSHKAFSTCHQYVLYIWQGCERTLSSQQRCVSPESIVYEEPRFEAGGF